MFRKSTSYNNIARLQCRTKWVAISFSTTRDLSRAYGAHYSLRSPNTRAARCAARRPTLHSSLIRLHTQPAKVCFIHLCSRMKLPYKRLGECPLMLRRLSFGPGFYTLHICMRPGAKRTRSSVRWYACQPPTRPRGNYELNTCTIV